MAKSPRRGIPKKLRRLTRKEAAHVGVTYSSKRRVSANIKQVTKRTLLYTDREVAQAHIRQIARTSGQKFKTKETYTRSRREVVKTTETGKKIIHYNNLNKSQLIKLVKKYPDRRVYLVVHSERNADYGPGPRWSSLGMTDASTLLSETGFPKYLRAFNISSEPDRYALVVLPS